MPTREEMIAFIQNQQAPQGQQAPPSREQMISFLQQKSQPEGSVLGDIGRGALDVAGAVGQFVDTYTGAPVRAGIGALQDGKNPLSAAAGQFGEDPSLAPTGKQIAQKAGVPDTALSEVIPSLYTDDDKEAEAWFKFKRGGAADVTASGAAGLGIDIAADPTNIIPGAAIAKGVKFAGKGIKTAAKGASVAADAIGSTRIAQLPGKALKGATVKVGSTLTGLPEKNIRTYIEKTAEVDKIIAKHGGDMSLAADELREKLQGSIQSKIGSLNNEVKEAIQKSPAGSFASNDAVIKALEHVKEGINPQLYPGNVAEIEEIVEKIKTLSPELSAEAANEAKRFLQDQAKGSYIKGGQLFTQSKDASRAAKAGAREARKIEMQLAPGTVEPNKNLARLHRYQDNANKALIAPGKSESALMTAGSGANARNAKNLKDISEMTGFDALGEAEKLSAARDFANPGWVPVDATGKSGTRMAMGALGGSLVAGPLGTAAGIAATSPAVLKAAIKAGTMSRDVIKKLAGGAVDVTDEVIERAIRVAGTERGQRIMRGLDKGAKQAHIGQVNDVAESKPQKGPEKWANDGVQKLLESGADSATVERLRKTKQGRETLIWASKLSPDSKAMKKVLEGLKTSDAKGGE